MLFPGLALSNLGKSVEMKDTVLPDGQAPTVVFIVLAQQCGPKANATEVGTAKNSEGRNFDFEKWN